MSLLTQVSILLAVGFSVLERQKCCLLIVSCLYSLASRSGNPKVQLQMAARQGAARKLYEETRIDVRSELDRLKPAVLQMNPIHDKDGVKFLKNENDNRLFYFLQVTEVDFVQEGVS